MELYAYSVNQGSGTTYTQLDNAGIIDELREDYEDMHGMSTYSINEYISKRLNVTPSDKCDGSSHSLSKILLMSQTIELIANKYKLSIEEARDSFYKSKVIEKLDDDETGLYGESALYLLSSYEKYLNK